MSGRTVERPSSPSSGDPRERPGVIMCALCGAHFPDAGADLCPTCWADTDIDTMLAAGTIELLP